MRIVEKISDSLGVTAVTLENEKKFLENPSFRQSSINAYLNCPAHWWLRYCGGVDSPSGEAANLGTLVHKACEVMTRAALGETEIGEEKVDELLRNSVAFGPGAVLSALDATLQPESYDEALRMLTEWWLRDRVKADSILGVEWQFSHKIRGFTYTGTVDLVYRDGDRIVVRDYKTGYIQTPVEQSIQLRLYALAAALEWGDPARDCVDIEYWWMRFGTQRSMTLTPDDHWKTIGYLSQLCAGMLADEDPQPRASQACTYCPAREACPVWSEPPAKPQDIVDAWVTAKERSSYWTKQANALRGRVQTLVEQHGGAVLDESGRGAKMSHRTRVIRPLPEIFDMVEADEVENIRDFILEVCTLNESKFNAWLMRSSLAEKIESVSRSGRSPQLRMSRGQSAPTIDAWEGE